MTPALFSVSYAGYWGQASLSLESFIAKAGQLGFPSVMLAGKRPHLSPLDATPEYLSQIQNALRQNNVACDAIAGYTNFAPGPAVEIPDLEFQIAYVQRLAEIASSLGAKIVRVFTAYQDDAVTSAALWNRVVSALRECADRAQSHNITLAIQNHHDLALDTASLLDLLTQIDRPNCKLGFDAWSPALRGEDLFTAAKQAAPHTVLTTNADYLRIPRYRYRPELVNYERLLPDQVQAVPFGKGFIDYPAFFQGLREGGFDGLAVYEICSPISGGPSPNNLDRCAAAYLAWLQATATH